MNTMTDMAGKAWSWAFCRAIRARQRAKALLREESAQGTTEYAIIAIVAFKSKVEELWNAIKDGINSL